MTKSHQPKTKRVEPIKTTIRISPDEHAALQAAAEANRRTMNAELLARIHGSQVATLRTEIVELKAMVRELLDLARERT